MLPGVKEDGESELLGGVKQLLEGGQEAGADLGAEARLQGKAVHGAGHHVARVQHLGWTHGNTMTRRHGDT